MRKNGISWSYEGNFSNNELDGYGVLKTRTFEYAGYFKEGKKMEEDSPEIYKVSEYFNI